ncbi:MAG: hypothetical protein WD649_00825, partial [Thermoleophilaceae bacterium]
MPPATARHRPLTAIAAALATLALTAGCGGGDGGGGGRLTYGIGTQSFYDFGNPQLEKLGLRR